MAEPAKPRLSGRQAASPNTRDHAGLCGEEIGEDDETTGYSCLH